MRSLVSFLIGCVVGAAGVLGYLHETAGAQPASATAAESPAARRDSPTRTGSAPPSVRETGALVSAGPARVLPSGLIIPVQGVPANKLRRDFTDPRGGGRTHGALDILAPTGTPVLAVTSGRIRKLFTSKAGGLTIYQYDSAEEICYYYAHLDRYAPGVVEGMTVAQGDVIGYVGVTGNARGTPHLHFSVTLLTPTKEWWKGEAIDPFPLLTGR